MKIGIPCTTLPFKRKLREDEKPRMESDMNEAFDFLGIKNRALIIHGSVYPDIEGANHFIGSPYYQTEFNKTAKLHGFNCIQQGPNGELCKNDNSPYKASIYAKNPLFLNYGKLSEDSFANILSKEEVDELNITQKPSGLDYEMTDFDEARAINKILINKAFDNFEMKLNDGDKKAEKLNQKFRAFKSHNPWVKDYGVFHVLSKIHGTDEFSKWHNEVDKHLFKQKNSGDLESIERYDYLNNRYSKDIEKYAFCQFLVDKQEQEDRQERERDGIRVIGDLLVGFSYADELIHEDAFLPNWKIGAEYGGPCNSPQIWNNPLPDPDKLFNPDGSLGVSGQLLYDKVSKASENVENLRIDNAMGLVDPYVYRADSVKMVVGVQDGVTCSIADRGSLRGGNLSYLDEVDKKGNYKKILHNIIIPALRDNGIDPKGAVWENLGDQTDAFKQVFEREEKLPGIILSTGARTEELCFDWAPKKDKSGNIVLDKEGNGVWRKSLQKPDWSMIGSHDNVPTFRYLNQSWIHSNRGWESAYLGGFLNPDPKKYIEKERMTTEIENNPRMRLKAKYAELMRGSQNIQLTFSDWLGIDKVYNPRDNSQDTWKTRVTVDYEDRYHRYLETEERPVMNMPELVGIAVNAKAGMLIASDIEPRAKVRAVAEPILEKMKHWSEILKEEEII